MSDTPWSKEHPTPGKYDGIYGIRDANGSVILEDGQLTYVTSDPSVHRLWAEAPAMAELLGGVADRLAEIQDTRDADTHGLVVEARVLLSRVRGG